MATPGFLLAQLFKRITCFGRAFRMKVELAVMAVDEFFDRVKRFDERVFGENTVRVSGGW